MGKSILYSGQRVDFEPILYRGQPLFEALDGTIQVGGQRHMWGGEYGVITVRDGMHADKRTVIMRLRRPETGETLQKRADGEPHRVFSELYRKKNGNIFGLPVVDDPSKGSTNQQTVQAITVIDGRPQNLYLNKGFRYATPEDVFACIERASVNESDASQRKKAADPSQQIKALTESLAEAMRALAQSAQQPQAQSGGRR